MPSNTVDGYDAEFWNESYRLLRDAVEEHLGQFMFDDDVAEEAIFTAAIARAGSVLRDVTMDAESGEWIGALRQPRRGVE